MTNEALTHSGFTNSVPYLYTERLMLREYRRQDFDVFAAHLADPVSAAHLVPADRHAAWRIFCSQAGLWLLHGAGWWAVEEKETGRPVGNIGAFFREDSTVMELGWNTYRAFWGRDSRTKRRRQPCTMRSRSDANQKFGRSSLKPMNPRCALPGALA